MFCVNYFFVYLLLWFHKASSIMWRRCLHYIALGLKDSFNLGLQVGVYVYICTPLQKMTCLLSKAAASWSLRHIYCTLCFVEVKELEETWWNDVSPNKTFLCLSSEHSWLELQADEDRQGWILIVHTNCLLVIFTSCKLQQKNYVFQDAEPLCNIIVANACSLASFSTFKLSQPQPTALVSGPLSKWKKMHPYPFQK